MKAAAITSIEYGLPRVERGGTFLQFGIPLQLATAEPESFKICNHETAIAGSMALPNGPGRAGGLLAGGVLRPDALVSHRPARDESPQAAGLFRAGNGREIRIRPDLRRSSRPATGTRQPNNGADL